ATTPAERPASFAAYISSLREPVDRLPHLGMKFYKQLAKIDSDDSKIREFIGRCPPFRALLLATCITEYERGIRDLKSPKSYRAGPFDLWMSVYLPYFHRFITAESRQYNALKEVASVGDINVDICFYTEFRKSLLIG